MNFYIYSTFIYIGAKRTFDLTKKHSYYGESTQPLGPLCLWQCSHNFSEQSMKCLLLWFQLFQESQSTRCPSCPLARAAAVLCLHCCQKSSSFLEGYIEWYYLMMFWMISFNDIYQDNHCIVAKIRLASSKLPSNFIWLIKIRELHL